jgi:PhzF family phenazine biosynthesis protein
MSTRFWQVDAFSSEPFRGNPAGVCLLDQPRSEQWMQHVALEMNLSETAFVALGEEPFPLRWFTPACEVRLCGHATLASAHVLWKEGLFNPDRAIEFDTLYSGKLSAQRAEGGIELDFPARPPQSVPSPPGLSEALGIEPMFVARGGNDYLIVADEEATVRALRPDISKLRDLEVRGVIVTARAAEFDFISRFFAPAAGIDEDPVTGSAHCCLAPYWAEQLGKKHMIGFQASARGGVVEVTVEDDRVKLGGHAVITLRGELLV